MLVSWVGGMQMINGNGSDCTNKRKSPMIPVKLALVCVCV